MSLCKLPTIEIPIINGLVIMMGGISLGMSLSYPSPTTEEISNKFSLSVIQATMFNVSGFIAAFFGSIAINLIIPIVGRGISAFITSLVAIGSFIGVAFAQQMWLIFFFRVINGVTIGCYSTICPVFLVEIAPSEKVGQYGYFNQIGLAIGFLFPAIFGFFANYSYMSILCMIPAVIMVLMVLFVPSKVATTTVKASPFKVFHYPKELAIAFCLMFFLQFSGINALLSNLEPMIKSSGIEFSSSVIALIANIVQIFATVLASFIVDRFGKRLCWLVSSFGQMVSFIILSCQQYLSLPGGVFLLGLFAEQLTYGIGTGPIPFAQTALLFPLEVRSTAMGICTGVSWILSAIICFIWPLMLESMELGGSFAFFAGISLLSAVFGFFCIKNVDSNKSGVGSDEDSDMERRLAKSKGSDSEKADAL